MIFSHIEYCFINWSLTSTATLKSIESLFKKAIKTFDKKALSFHHCDILERHTFLSFDHFKRLKYACLVYKVLHNLAPRPLHGFFQRLESGGSTRASVNGDCVIPFRRTTFGQNVLSIIGGKLWNSLPLPVRVSYIQHF